MTLKAEDRKLAGEPIKGQEVMPKLGTGLLIWSGTVSEEYLSELQPWSRAYQVFREMRDSAVIGGLLEAIKTPLLGADFDIHPAGNSDVQKRQAEFLRSTTIDGFPDMEWREHVEEMLDFVDLGFSLAEKVLYKYKDGSLRLRALVPIGQDTLYRWGDPDEFGRVTSFIQQDIVGSFGRRGRSGIREAPIDKLVHFTWRPKKRSPMGSPILRSLYRPWYFVKNLEAIEAIGAERDIGGAPVVKLGEGFYTAEQISSLEAALKGLRMDESLYLILPHGMEIEAFAGGDKIYNVREMIRDYQHLIRQRFFADFLALGSEQVGTQALAREMTTFFGSALQSIQLRMEDVWNHQLVPWIFKWNGINIPQDQLPKIKWQNPSRHSLQSLAQTLTTLVNGQILTRDEEIEALVRREIGLPQLDSAKVRVITPPVPGKDTNVSGDDTGVKNRQPGDSSPNGKQEFVNGTTTDQQEFAEVQLVLDKTYPPDDDMDFRYTYSIVTPDGALVGFLLITIKGNRAYIEAIQLNPSAGGPASIAQIIRQFRQLHPEVREIGGFRISGVRKDRAEDITRFLTAASEAGLEVYSDRSEQLARERWLTTLKGQEGSTIPVPPESLAYTDA